MAKRRLSAILAVVLGGLFLVGCECNQHQWPGLYENSSGADWREAMQNCKTYCADSCDPQNYTDLSSLKSNFNGDDWRAAMQDCRTYCSETCEPRDNSDLSSLESNFNGTDWIENVAGTCCAPAGCVPPAPGK